MSTKQSAFLLKQYGTVDKRYTVHCVSARTENSVSLANYGVDQPDSTF